MGARRGTRRGAAIPCAAAGASSGRGGVGRWPSAAPWRDRARPGRGRCPRSSPARRPACAGPRPGGTARRPSPPGAGRRVCRPAGAVGAADRRPGHEAGHRVATEGHDQGRVQDLELSSQERGAGGDLVGLRVAVLRRAALDDVRDEDVLAPPADRAEQADEEVAGPAHERAALAILVHPGTLSHEDDLRAGMPLAGDGACPPLVEPAAGAGPDLRRDRLERRAAFGLGHAGEASVTRRDAAWTHPRATRTSAISTAFVAAPLRMLSETTQKARPRPSGIDGSVGPGRRRSRRSPPPRWQAGRRARPGRPGRRRRARPRTARGLGRG